MTKASDTGYKTLQKNYIFVTTLYTIYSAGANYVANVCDKK